MQTLKTAAIVVLMMIVLYGAYVSMTTPPDPLPSEIIPLIVDSEEFEISQGFPESIADLGIDPGQALTGVDGTAANRDPNPAEAGGPVEFSLDSVDRSFADLPPPPTPAPGTPSMGVQPRSVPVLAPNESSTSYSFSDQSLSGGDPPASAIAMDLGDPSRATRLPPVDANRGGAKPDPERDYPDTGNRFELPDPNAAASIGTQSDRGTPGVILASPSDGVAAAGLANAIATADRQFAADRRREALATLSLFYETPNLTPEQREQLVARLDPLARDVVYSPEHLLEKPHRVGPNETLMDIARRYEVPWQLLANINGIGDPVTVLPGRDLKIVRGPFRADVDLTNMELTLFVGDLYAGRFPIAVGQDPSPKPGTYTIQEKQSAKTYYDVAGTPIPPGNPRNPYGSMWIDLGSGLSIHGSPKPDEPSLDGCISVAGNYARDVFGILSEGSSVTIR